MKKIKQLANNAFVRPDRTEVLSEGLQEAERRIDQIKITCETMAKKVHACLQGQGKDSQIDKRIRKVPEFLLGSAMIANGKQLGDGSVLGEVLAESGQIEMKLGQAVVEYEVKIEESVLKPLQQLMDNDLPNIYKLKRQLGKYTADMDVAKAKLQQASRHSMSGGQAGKIDNIKDEWEDCQQKVEQCRDNLAAEMYSLIARESELSRLIVDFLNYQKEYHHSVYSILSELISGVDSCVASSIHKPVYGLDLDEHLKTSQKSIAYPIELCVCGLLETALEEEGLFRMAGSASKVKKLKSAFDAGIMDLGGLLAEFSDPHVIANALKCYLRELPEPLLTFDLYNDWMNAIRIGDNDEKLKALWVVIKKLPSSNYDNLRYLVKFLKELSNHQECNKMSPANIAIVVGPNLLWCNTTTSAEDLMGDNNQMGLNMTMTHHYSSVLDQLVTYCSYFFPEDIEFYVTCVKPTELELDRNSKNLVNGGTSLATSTIEESSSSEEQNHKPSSQIKRSHSNSSVDEHSPPHGSPKPVLRRKNKPAPVPPVQNKNPLANVAFKGSCVVNSPVKENHTSTYQPTPAIPSAFSVTTVVSQPSFKKNNSLVTESSKVASKEKREGVWIPPSPRETGRKKMSGPTIEEGTSPPNSSSSTGPPTKPPPPLGYSQSQQISSEISARLKQGASEAPSKPASPLRHKTSFKSSNSIEGNSNSTNNNSPLSVTTVTSTGKNNTTDNIGINANTNSASAFSSLPRHFHTENSYKNQRAPRPPSMWGVAPPAPPQAPVISNPPVSLPTERIAPTPELEEPPTSSIQIGFERVESEIRKDSVSSSGGEEDQKSNSISAASKIKPIKQTEKTVVIESGETVVPPSPMPRPIPAPRSSLLSQSNSFSHPANTTTTDGKGEVPVVRERPSLMAKPRDLTRRNHTQSAPFDHSSQSGGGGDGRSASRESETHDKEGIDSSVHSHHQGTSQQDEKVFRFDQRTSAESEDSSESGQELPKNNGVGKHISQFPPQSPSGKNQNRPPRPQPPAPPKVKVSPGESTDL